MSYKKIERLNILFRKDQEKNKDVINAITGMRGDGKSNFSMVSGMLYTQQFGLICNDCGHEWIYTGKAIYSDSNGMAQCKDNLLQPCPKCKSQKTMHPKKFNFYSYMAYDNKEVEEKVKDRSILADWSPLLCDETVRWAFSQDFAKTENKEMKKLFNQHRPRKLVQYLNIPRFHRLDSSYREIASYWIWVMQRTEKNALAMIFIQDKASRDDPYRLKELYDLVGSYNEHTPMEKMVAKCQFIMRKHPCALDFFLIPPLPEDIYRDYEAYRNAKVFEKEEVIDEIDQKEIAKIMVFNLVNQWPIFSRKIKEARFTVPTIRLIEEFICTHPQTRKPIIRYTTVRNWINEIKKVMK